MTKEEFEGLKPGDILSRCGESVMRDVVARDEYVVSTRYAGYYEKVESNTQTVLWVRA